MRNKIKKFFKIMFGPNYPGYIAIFTKPNMKTRFFSCSEIDNMYNYILKNAEKSDVYFSCGLLRDKPTEGRGKAHDIMAIPGFWLDLDLETDDQNNNNRHPSKKNAKKILNKFPLPPTLIINSGYGFHCYWLLAKPWKFKNEAERQAAAVFSKRFQRVLIGIFRAHGYRLDNTSDFARVLRVPGTSNHKRNAKVPVKFVISQDANSRRYTLEDIEKVLVSFETNPPKKFKGTIAKARFPKSDVEKIMNRCEWFDHCYADAVNLPEPEWFYLLTTIAYCKNAASWACTFSQGYEGYTKEETLRKLDRIQKAHNTPVSCKYVRDNFGEYCDRCTHNVQSPYILGFDRSPTALESLGFIYDSEGSLKSINGNIFARYILSRFKLLYTRGGRFYLYRDGVWNYVDEIHLSRQLRDLVHQFAPDFWSPRLESLYFEALKREAPPVDELDTKRNYLNLSNGMLNLETLKLVKHLPGFHSSIRLPIEYNLNDDCPVFDKFLLDIFEGDSERIQVIEEIMGYCLTADTSAQKAFFFYGKGANGKSLLAEIILHLCGKQNVSAVPLTDLEKPFARYELVGKLLNLATENEVPSAGLNTASFKSIVSGDPIQVEKKFEQSFMYQPICKMIFSLNNLPYSRDRSWGFQRRLIVIPFNRTFREDDPDTMNYNVLRDTLMAEMSGILNRALQGLARLRNNGYHFSHSQAIAELQNEYKFGLNPYSQFVEELIEQGDETDRVSNEVIRKTFAHWCAANGHDRLSKTSHAKMLIEIRDAMHDARIDFKISKSGGVRYIYKICLKTRNKKKSKDLMDFGK